MTTTELLKKPVRYLPWGVYGVAALLMAATVTRVSGYSASNRQVALAMEQSKVRNKEDAEKAKDVLAEQKRAGDQLKRRNAFVPPPSRPNPPVCQGIIGQSALFGDRLYKAGERVGTAEVISVGTTEVVIKWEDREMTLKPFETDGRGGSTPGRGTTTDARASGAATSGPAPTGAAGQRAATTTQVRGAGAQGRPAGPPTGPGGAAAGGAVDAARAEFMNMSPEERQQMVDRFRNMSPDERDRFREEQRQRFGERGGPAGGGMGGANPRGGRGR